jgi:type IV pilus assembly protein PilA
LTLADGWKTAIAEYYANTGNMPATTANLTGTCNSVGKYESSISVSGGTVVIAYGNQANVKLATSGSNTLALVPYVNTNNDVIWVCGAATAPTGATTIGSVVTSTVPAQYLPTSCHS